MSGVQVGAWVLTLVFSFFLSLVFLFSSKARVIPIFRYGILFIVFGVVLSCLTGKKCVDVLTLEDAGGFGRAYGVGLAVVIAGSILALKNLVVWIVKRTKEDGDR